VEYTLKGEQKCHVGAGVKRVNAKAVMMPERIGFGVDL
jgi:hypothetical protein